MPEKERLAKKAIYKGTKQSTNEEMCLPAY